jgi:S1-C subfamily serine protease
VRRSIASLRAKVREGNSGGPMVDAGGRVVATIFAATVGRGQAGGYAVPNGVVAKALDDRGGPVGTGSCTR